MDAPTTVPPAERHGLAGAFAPRADRAPERPPQIDHGLEDVPPRLQTAGLAAQQIAIQAIYLILPGVVGEQFGLLPIDVVRFLCLSVAAIGIAGLLQALPRGPVGSGYAVPSIPSPVFVAVYLLAAPGADIGVAAALTAATGVIGLVLSVMLRRLHAIVPTEVAGVVVFLIGISLLPRAFASTVGDAAEGNERALLALATLAAMMAVALVGGRLSRFAVLVGAAGGTAVALLLDVGLTADAGVLDRAPWFALPLPEWPRPSQFDASLLPAFCVALLASFASWTGDLIAFQRAADGAWRRPDGPPIRRGLMAQSLGLVTAGLLGGMAPSTSSACVGLAIATRTLARRVAVVGALALLVLSCCPKLLALITLLPEPVKAAMLGYVCCFMLAAGCQLMTSRMLDTRRTFTIGMGIAIGIAVLAGLPGLLRAQFGVMGSPVTAGAAVAIVMNLLTAPLVTRRTAFRLMLDAEMPRRVDDRVEALGGAWGARRQTMQHLGHALLELAEVLAARGVAEIGVQARHADDQVELTVSWLGTQLPRPTPRPDAHDLEGAVEVQEAFALWLATRHADRIEQRVTAAGCEIRLVFAD
jgi:NCS2 family nucleobase:cation symporter-2